MLPFVTPSIRLKNTLTICCPRPWSITIKVGCFSSRSKILALRGNWLVGKPPIVAVPPNQAKYFLDCAGWTDQFMKSPRASIWLAVSLELICHCSVKPEKRTGVWSVGPTNTSKSISLTLPLCKEASSQPPVRSMDGAASDKERVRIVGVGPAETR